LLHVSGLFSDSLLCGASDEGSEFGENASLIRTEPWTLETDFEFTESYCDEPASLQ
jgi:hypothetical protein